MATVTVEVNGRPYSVGCADGQEDRVRQLARQFDDHVRQIARDVGQVGDLRLFLMAALLVSDELADIRGQLARAQQGGGEDAAEPAEADYGPAVAAIEKLADRIEKLALETA
jgi:cell division protein ZapA